MGFPGLCGMWTCGTSMGLCTEWLDQVKGLARLPAVNLRGHKGCNSACVLITHTEIFSMNNIWVSPSLVYLRETNCVMAQS